MKIGFIGLGIMGNAMCQNIIRKHDGNVYVYDIVPEAMTEVKAMGAIACENALEVARNSELIFTMVQTSEQALSVYEIMLPALEAGKICADMSTIDPDATLAIYQKLKEKGADFLDAPVVRSKAAAIMGTVGIYVGGDKKVYMKIKPVLNYMGKSIIHIGGIGSGIIMKICHNMAVAQIQNGVNEALALASANGIDMDRFAAALSYGGGQNAYFDSKLTALKNEDYTAEFTVENMAKDLNICERFAGQHKMELPGLKAAKSVYQEALEAGMDKLDYAATVEVVRKKK